MLKIRQISSCTLRLRLANHKILNERHKYIVLLPEIPSDTPETNPLLREEFKGVTPGQCVRAVSKLLIEYESGVHKLDQDIEERSGGNTVQNVVLPLDQLSAPLDQAWGAFKLLHTVKRDQGFSDAFLKVHPRLVRAKQEKFLSPSIYKAFKELQGCQLSPVLRRLVEKQLLESELCGTHLPDRPYAHMQTIFKTLAKFRNTYDQNVQKATSSFSLRLSPKDVRNFSPDLLRMLAEDKSRPSEGPWALGLSSEACYHLFLEECDDSMLRWNAWLGYNSRANASRTSGNSIPIEEIRHQRSELAKLLGYPSFAQLSMRTKMAGSVENVQEMITTLQVRSRATMLRELDDLQAFCNRSGYHRPLQPWDVPYWQRLHREHLFQIDDSVVRQYLPFPKVLQGVFDLCRKLFGVTIKEKALKEDAWHPDVKFYCIEDESGKEVAQFFLDPYQRIDEKFPGAWLEIGRSRSDVVGCQPLSYLVFSFPPPISGQPSRLSFADLNNLLQKVGHLLQHSLATSPYAEVAGLNNLEWDVVGVCPLVLSSLLSRPSLMRLVAPDMPPQLHQTLLNSEKYMQGLRLAEELFYSALDLELYSGKEFWVSLSKRLWTDFLPFPFDKEFGRPCSLSQIFTGAYPAAYFSHLWAEMIAADVHGAFEEVGADDEKKLGEIGRRFRDTFLCSGGSCHPSEVFRQFRGRDPSPDALLLSLGLS